jgi:hypothetical protein
MYKKTHILFLSKLLYFFGIQNLITPAMSFNVSLYNYTDNLIFYLGTLAVYLIMIFILLKVKRYLEYEDGSEQF